MNWMIAFIMEIAVSVCRLAVYGSVNGVVVDLLTHLLKVI